MEVHLNPGLETKVSRIAAENQTGADEYVQQLVESCVDHDAWFGNKVSKGLNQLDRANI
jgi:hypothetical protein